MVKLSSKNRIGFTYTRSQLTRLVDCINNPKVAIATFMGRMIGLRIEEVCKLKWENIDTTNLVVAVLDAKWRHRHRDGYGKDRYVRLPRMAVGPMEKWRSIIGGGKWFLPSDKSPDLPMRKKTLYEGYAHARRVAGLDDVHYEYTRRVKHEGKVTIKKVFKRKLNFHSLRAYWVVDCRKRQIPIEIVAEQAGHVDINTTKGYSRFNDEEKNSILDAAYSKSVVLLGEKTVPDAQATPVADDRSVNNGTKNLTPREYLQMQFLRGQISEPEYVRKLELLNQG